MYQLLITLYLALVIASVLSPNQQVIRFQTLDFRVCFLWPLPIPNVLGFFRSNYEMGLCMLVIYLGNAPRKNWKWVREAGYRRRKAKLKCDFKQSPMEDSFSLGHRKALEYKLCLRVCPDLLPGSWLSYCHASHWLRPISGWDDVNSWALLTLLWAQWLQ